MEEIQSRHRKEQRELQSRITQKRKNATKKTRKGVNDECEALQRELQDRQNAELSTLDLETMVPETNNLNRDGHSAGPESGKASEPEVAEGEVGVNSNFGSKFDTLAGPEQSVQKSKDQPKRPNRQKARLARRAAEQEAQAAQAAEEAANLPNLREQEMAAMQLQIERYGLHEINIRPDGHCLYSAVATVLPPGRIGSTVDARPYQLVRTSTASFISDHPDDFAAFIEEPLESYVEKIRDTAEWGGQLELQAISRGYGVQVNVLQADGRVEKITPDAKSEDHPVWLAYYRHSFGLGEHYNALKNVG